MGLTDTQELLQACLELQKEIENSKPGDYGFVVTLPGTNRAYFNLK